MDKSEQKVQNAQEEYQLRICNWEGWFLGVVGSVLNEYHIENWRRQVVFVMLGPLLFCLSRIVFTGGHVLHARIKLLRAQKQPWPLVKTIRETLSSGGLGIMRAACRR